MTEPDAWLKEGWEVPASDDEMEYDLWKCVDNKLIACFDTLSRQKTLKVSASLYGRPTLGSLNTEFDNTKDNAAVSEPNKPMDENESSIFDAFDYHEDKTPDNPRKRGYQGPPVSRQLGSSKKATLGNVMNNMMRHKRLEIMGARPQVVKNTMYCGEQQQQQQQQHNIRHSRVLGSVAHDITQNVMAQSRSINESMASLNMPRPSKNMPLTTPQPTQLVQTPQQGMEVPRSPNLNSPNQLFGGNVPTMSSHASQAMGPPNQTMISSNIMVRGPDRRNPPHHYMGMPDGAMAMQQQMYQRIPGMYKSPHGLTLVQGNNMGPRMVYNPVSGQTIMTTQHSGLIGPPGGVMGQQQGGVMGNNIIVARSGMLAPQAGLIPGMGPVPPNMSATMVQSISQQQRMLAPDNRQIVVSQAMIPGNMPHSLMGGPPNQTINPGGIPAHLQQALSQGMRPGLMSPGDPKPIRSKMGPSSIQQNLMVPNSTMSPSPMGHNAMGPSPIGPSPIPPSQLTPAGRMSPNTRLPNQQPTQMPSAPEQMTPVQMPPAQIPPAQIPPAQMTLNSQVSPTETSPIDKNLTLNTAVVDTDTDVAGKQDPTS